MMNKPNRREQMTNDLNSEFDASMGSEVWEKFVLEVEQAGLYKHLKKSAFGSLGYLYLLEKVLGAREFRQLCPLTLALDSRFAAEVLPIFNSWDDQNVVYNLFYEYYCEAQQEKAEALWPQGIEKYIGQVLALVVRNNITESLWPIYQTFLSVRYGLEEGSQPIEELPDITGTVWKKLGAEVYSGEKKSHWEEQTIEMLTNKPMRIWMIEFARSFGQGFTKKWKDILKQTQKEFEKSSVFNADSFLDVCLYEIISMRIVNALDREGIYTLEDLAGFSEEKIREIPNIAEGAIKEIKKVFQVYGLQFAMSKEAIQEWKEKHCKSEFKL